jgi:DNA-binding LytR/AlgR family response regulator
VQKPLLNGVIMKVSIEEISRDQAEEEIIIRCYEITNDILRLVSKLEPKSAVLLGYKEGGIHRIRMQDVYYFDAVDNKVFIYCKNAVFESKQKLYELEEQCQGSKLFRATKSSILNITKITYIKPSISGRFEARLDNGETVTVSRQYVPVLKKLLNA